jgi:hypothetical protein
MSCVTEPEVSGFNSAEMGLEVYFMELDHQPLSLIWGAMSPGAAVIRFYAENEKQGELRLATFQRSDGQQSIGAERGILAAGCRCFRRRRTVGVTDSSM